MKYKTEVGFDHVLMDWMIPHCAWVANNFQVKLHWRSCAIWRSVLGAKPFCKLDSTDEFLLLTPTGAIEDTLCETS